MSDARSELDEVKKDIRSLLISAPNGLTPDMLENDYLTVIGKPIPSKKFGFSNSLAFFRSLRDILQVTNNRGHQILLGIADESTEHIMKMVQKQKKAKFYTCVNPTGQSTVKKKYSDYCKYPTALTRSGMITVLKKYSNGFSITKLHEYYKEVNGTTLDVDGIKTIPPFIRTMPDIALLDYGKKEKNGNNFYIYPSKKCSENPGQCSTSNSSADTSNTTLSKLPFSNFNVTDSSTSVASKNNASTNNFVSKKKGSKTLKETNPGKAAARTTKRSTVTNLESSSDDNTVESSLNSFERSIPKLSFDPSPNLSSDPSPSHPCARASKITIDIDDDFFGFEEATPSASAMLKQEILAVLEEHDSEVRSMKLPTLYKKKYDKDLNLHSHGYYSIVELLATMTDKISMCRVNRTGDWILKLRHLLPNKKANSAKEKQVDKVAQLAELQKEFKELLDRYKGGIAIDSLEDLYEMHFNRPLPLKDQSVKSAPELICKIADTMDLRNGHICLQPSSAHDALRKLEPATQCAPLDAVGFGVKYLPPFLPTAQWGYFSCYVTYVNSPSDFRIQVIAEDTTVAFERLMDDMGRTYNHSTAKAYRIPPYMIVPGQICVAIYHGDNNWNRAVVEDHPVAGFVKVRYVDYGDIAAVSTGAIFFLKQKYRELPILEVHARLASVQPANFQQWDLSARKLLIEFSKNRALTAKVIGEVECSGHTVFSLELCDVSAFDDIYLTDLLLQKGLAVVHNEEDLTPEEIEELFEINASGKNPGSKKTSVPKGLPPPYQEAVSSPAGYSNAPQQPSPPPNLPPLSVPNPPPGFSKDTPQRNQTASEISHLLEKFKHQQEALEKLERSKKAQVSKQKKVMPKSSKSKQQKRFIKPFRLTDRLQIHVVNFKGNPLVLSGEISRIFRPDAGDMLAPLLMMREIHENFPELVLPNNDENEFLFDDFARMQVKDAFKSDNLVKSVVTLHRLSDVPEMVAVLDAPDREAVIRRLNQIVATFDPDADYWFQDGNEANQKTLKKIVGKPPGNQRELQVRRDFLLQQVVSGSAPSHNTFNQLKNVMGEFDQCGGAGSGFSAASGSNFEASAGDMCAIPSDETAPLRDIFAEIRQTS